MLVAEVAPGGEDRSRTVIAADAGFEPRPGALAVGVESEGVATIEQVDFTVAVELAVDRPRDVGRPAAAERRPEAGSAAGRGHLADVVVEAERVDVVDRAADVAEADIGVEIGITADSEAIAESAVDTGLPDIEVEAIERTVAEVGLVAVILGKEFAVEAGDTAELAVETNVPALGLEPEVEITVRLGPGISAGQADAAAAEAVVGAGLDAMALGLQIVVNVECNAFNRRRIMIAEVVTAVIAVAPEAKADRGRRLAGFRDDFVGALVPQRCRQAGNCHGVERRTSSAPRPGRSPGLTARG